jgi:hypothetical protein
MTESFGCYSGPSAWRSSDYQGDSWIDELSELEEAELRTAAKRLPKDYADWLGLERRDVPLPILSERLAETTRMSGAPRRLVSRDADVYAQGIDG